MLTFFDNGNFVYTDKIKNIAQAFAIIFKKFNAEKVVDNDFEKLLYKREAMSSTAFGRVAIPHSFDIGANKSRGFIIINPHGIKWSDGNEVYLVIGLAIDPSNKKLFREVFDELSGVVTDANNVRQLINCKNYNDFILKLVSLL